MYNLLVSSKAESWSGDPYILDMSRFGEHTERNIREKYRALTQDQIHELIQLPCLFAYEEQCQKDPKFGFIREAVRRQEQVKIHYEIIDVEHFLTYSDLLEMSFELGITSHWEWNRTHWAIKDVDLPKELRAKNIKLPSRVTRAKKAVDITKHYFDVALSFPGDIRNEVEAIVAELESEIGPDAYFYDNNYKAQLARPSLDVLLQDIYGTRSKLIVVFLCTKYQEKEWCGLEFRTIMEIVMERRTEKIMFIRMDDGKVNGVVKTDGYIDARTHTPKEIAKFIKERIDLIS